jgi:hypothetical protein
MIQMDLTQNDILTFSDDHGHFHKRSPVEWLDYEVAKRSDYLQVLVISSKSLQDVVILMAILFRWPFVSFSQPDHTTATRGHFSGDFVFSSSMSGSEFCGPAVIRKTHFLQTDFTI